MNTKLLLTGVASLTLTGLTFIGASAMAEPALTLSNIDPHAGHHHHHNHSAHLNAPIGVMGSHLHKKGEWMVSYRFMQMHMDGNRDGTDDLSAVEIATTVPNRFFGVTGQPPTLRVVPEEMTTDMHMIGGMYGVTDWLTIMAMGMYLDREMDHVTFAGGMGTTELGNFTTEASGFGDTRVAGLFRLYEDETHSVHLNAGLSLPTGSIDEEDTVLAPNSMTPRLRLPYAMQLGSGTFDAMPGVTYNGASGDWAWGGQYMAEVRLEDENDEGYALGDKHSVTGWGVYQWQPQGQFVFSNSLRLTASTQDSIDGIDPAIVAPVQTADPDNYGGEMVELGIGGSVTATQGALSGNRLAFEVSVPVYRDLNGPQLERDYSFTLGWQKAF